MLTLTFEGVVARWPILADGAAMTLVITVVSILAGTSVGLLLGVIRARGGSTGRVLAASYVKIIRNTPFLIQLFIVYFGLPFFGLRLDATTAAVIALSLYLAAYAAEIFRAGIEAIPVGQLEAAKSFGLGPIRTFQKIVLPQAIAKVYPAITSQFVLIMLTSSIASQISVEELTGAGAIVQGETFRVFETYAILTVIYFAFAGLIRAGMGGLHRFLFPHLHLKAG